MSIKEESIPTSIHRLNQAPNQTVT